MKPARTEAAPQPTATLAPDVTDGWDGPALFQRTDLTFDAGDRANASLYLCEPIGNPQAGLRDRLIGLLRARRLWSEQEPKCVRDDQREAYQDQLTVVEVVALQLDGGSVALARCEHPRFPSSAQRFDAWKAALRAWLKAS